MQIRQLEYLIALAREGHFARAAQACFVSQPALSDAVRKLEEELGVQLVQRRRAYEGLTPEGERVLVWAQKILSDYEGLCQDAAAAQEGLRGTLRMGSIPAASAAGTMLLDLLCREHPGVRVQLSSSMRSAEVLEAVRSFRLDVGLIYLDEHEPEGLHALPLYREDQVLLVPEDLVEGDDARDPWELLDELPLCLMSRGMRGRGLIDQALSARGLSLSPRIETDSLSALISLVSTGNWASVVSRQWLHGVRLSEQVRRIPLDTDVLGEVALVHREQDPGSRLVSALVAVAQETDVAGRLDAQES